MIKNPDRPSKTHPINPKALASLDKMTNDRVDTVLPRCADVIDDLVMKVLYKVLCGVPCIGEERFLIDDRLACI